MAHAGAIAGLEAKGFSPTIVAGTSMGAIIGAMYASGIPIDSVIAITRQQNWLEVFAPPRVFAGRSYEPVRPIVQFGVFPDPTRYVEGLIADDRVNRLLAGIFFEPIARARGDFNALPRRFRAVAMNLMTGNARVLDHGDLARAVRASMAVPGVFAPIIWDGTPLVDGGSADNVPVDVARGAGGRRVVAIDVLKPPGQIGAGALRVALRALRLTLRNATPETRGDITIVPALNPDLFEAMFVEDPIGLIEAGRRAALEQAPTFEGGAGPRAAGDPPPRFASLRLEANDSSVLPLVRQAFGSIAPGPWNPDAVMAAVDRLYSTGFFTGIWPSVEGPTDAPALVVHADARPPSVVSLMVGYDTDRSFRGLAALSRRFAARNELALTASGSGIESRASAALTRVLDSGISFRAGASFDKYAVRAVEDDASSFNHDVRRAGGSIGLQLGGVVRPLEAVAAIEAERIETPERTGLSWGPRVRILHDDTHGRVVGTPARLDAEWRFGDVAYHRFGLAGSIDRRTGPFLTALMADLSSAGGDPPEDVTPALGDDHVMPGLRWGRDRDRVRAVTGLDVAFATPVDAFFRLRLRTGAVAPSFDRLDSVRWLGGAEAGVVWWTPLGQMSADVGVTTRGDWRVGMDIGPVF